MQPPDDSLQAALERINYIDGQRLTQELLRKEQDFHIRVREWLSKSLFTAGVADGLEVTLGTDKKVSVSPGLAIDEAGHAIVLVEPWGPHQIDGRFLTIRFGEQTFRQAADGCLVGPIVPGQATVPTAWSGPTVKRTVPIFEFPNRIDPGEDRMRLVLAEFKFAADCKPIGLLSGPTRFAAPKQLAGIHTFALEGEKDIDAANPKILRFHVHGRRPTSVSLYLQAGKFSSVYYTELGSHGHAAGATAGTGGTGAAVWTTNPPSHRHGIDHVHDAPTASARVTSNYDALGTADLLGGESQQNLTDLVTFRISTPGVADGHQLSAWNDAEHLAHSHSATVNVSFDHAGSPDVAAREKNAISYVNYLRIKIDGRDVTEEVISHLAGNSIDNWTELGNGGAGHLLVTNGTGRIRLDLLPGVDIPPGPHTIELFVKEHGTDDRQIAPDPERPNGGKIYYNLYVEAE